MSWLTIAWSMCSAVSGLLGLLHFMLWLKDRHTTAYLLSASMAFSAAAVAMTELSMMHAQLPVEYAQWLQWQNLFIYTLIVSLVWLVYVHLGTARRWLAVTITLIWSIALVINFLSPGSLVYASIDALQRQDTFWGEQFTVAKGTANPWVQLANVAVVLILFYVIDAARRAWQLGERRKSSIIGTSVVVFLLFGGIHSILVDYGLIATPYMVSFAYLAIVLAMSYELVSDAVRVPRLTREIAANEQRWDALMREVELAVIVIDPQGRISYWNPFFENLSGYHAQTLRGRGMTDLVPPSDVAELEHRLAHAAEVGPRAHSRWTIVCASGEQRQLAWSSVRQVTPDGQYAGILAIGADITDGLRAQSELQRTRQEMERLMRANILGELASTLAHELNQPLAAILSNAQAAKRLITGPDVDLHEIAEIFDDIVRDDKRASEVIHGLRAMLRKGEMETERFTVDVAVKDVVRLVQGDLDANGVTIHIDADKKQPLIEAGRVEIQQVLMNLIVNAMRAFTGANAAARDIWLTIQPQRNGVLITVKDNGLGIPTANLPNLFEPFFTTRSGGLGMGLAITRRIVEAHGGKIWAENAPGGGAIFTFWLPAAEAQMEAAHG